MNLATTLNAQLSHPQPLSYAAEVGDLDWANQDWLLKEPAE